VPTLIHRQVEAARRGDHPRVIARLASGWAVLGDPQVLHGYCLLLPDPVVPHLNALEASARTRFLIDMAGLGDAVLAVTGALRINYEMLGNVEPALHAHVLPRFVGEPDEFKLKSPFFYDWSLAPAFAPDRDRPLMERLARELGR
jgi:diadenosine tetraphosphate (Ap4A) HIT family hydrolase